MDLIKTLFDNKDEKYRDFTAALIPTVDKDIIIGVRTPQLRKIAANMQKSDNVLRFLSETPHFYHEENLVHAFIISSIRDFSESVRLTEEFLPLVNNWAVCDSLRPVSFKKHKSELLPVIEKWLSSSHPYIVRFGIEMLMVHYLDEAFAAEQIDRVSKIRSDEYYVNMMIAWYLATALAKQWCAAVRVIDSNALPVWVHNKAIQKALESFRIGEDEKAYLRTKKR